MVSISNADKDLGKVIGDLEGQVAEWKGRFEEERREVQLVRRQLKGAEKAAEVVREAARTAIDALAWIASKPKGYRFKVGDIARLQAAYGEAELLMTVVAQPKEGSKTAAPRHRNDR